MAAQGHQGRFALASLSAGYEFRKETIAGTHGNETRRFRPFEKSAIEPPGSTLNSHSAAPWYRSLWLVWRRCLISRM
jgi:hypothetical protein